MTFALFVLAIWFAVSIVAGLLIGATIREISRDGK